MDCNVIKDLLPLYIDKCCSEESSALVREHLQDCPKCNEEYSVMLDSSGVIPKVPEAKETSAGLIRIDSFKAYILQSVLMFVSFALITVGVALEAASDYNDITNGLWAILIAVPSTGFMLSLANWYFLPFYKSRKQFSNASLLLTLVFILIALFLTAMHYEGISFYYIGFIICLVPTVVFCVISKTMSNVYAKKLGKE